MATSRKPAFWWRAPASGPVASARLAAAKLNPWAADLEANAKQLRWAVPADERLVFVHAAAAPYGHVTVLLDHNAVIVNLDPAYRTGSIVLPNPLALTSFAARPWTLVALVGGRERGGGLKRQPHAQRRLGFAISLSRGASRGPVMPSGTRDAPLISTAGSREETHPPPLGRSG